MVRISKNNLGIMRILLISYYFPPCGGAPVQRWLRFIPHLVRFGYQVTVLCSEHGDYPFIDEALCQKIPPQVQVIRVKAPQWHRIWQKIFGKKSTIPYGRIPPKKSLLTKLFIWLRINLIVPDLRVFWNPAAYRAALSELKTKPYSTLITTGPPHSSHLIGMRLQSKTKIRWFADFRDPWTDIHYLKLNPPLPIVQNIHKYLEKKVLSRADYVLIVSKEIADSLPEGNKLVLLNGFDPHDFEDTKYISSNSFRIKYVGQFTAGQKPSLITDLCKTINREFQLSMIGTQLSSAEVQKLRQSCINTPVLKGYVSHEQAIQEMVDADLLILLVNDYEGNRGMLTTKLFEYLASRTPILCFSPPEGAVVDILSQIDGAKVFSYNQISSAANWVDSLPLGLRCNGNIDSYSIDKQIVTLAEALSR
ncbi:MAG: glycosyltransferase [Candidatus Cloacimonetes bacterium]|nr:glycosyltransferase [Candidatus Cloacimonadota bacterium]